MSARPPHRTGSWRDRSLAAFSLWGGPTAWLIQLCAGETLTGWPCFPGSEHLPAPLAGYAWTRTAALLLLLSCALVAFFAALLAWRHRNDAASVSAASASARFLAMWGAILGVGFGMATLVTLIAFAMVPQCPG